MKKFIVLLLSGIILATCIGCTGRAGTATDEPLLKVVDVSEMASASYTDADTTIYYNVPDSPYFGSYYKKRPQGVPETAVNIFQDEKFQYGFNTVQTAGGTRDLTGYLDYKGKARFTGSDKVHASDRRIRARIWELGQWCSRGDLGDTSTRDVQEIGDEFIYSNKYKKVVVNPTDGYVTLRANCGEEYDFKERTQEQFDKGQWVHLLIEQFTSGAKYKFADLKEAYLYIDFKIDECTYRMGQGEQVREPAAQKAQIVWYFGYHCPGKTTIWFGIPIFDSYDTANKSYSSGEVFTYDPGMGYSLYSMAQDEIFPEGQPQVGVRYTKVIKMLDFIKYCYSDAVKKGEYNPATDKWEECSMENMNMGFEVPGTFDIQATFYNVGIYYDVK